MEIQIAGNIAVAQGIVPLIDLFDVLRKLFLNIREQQQVKFAGAVKVEPEAHFGLDIIIHPIIHWRSHLPQALARAAARPVCSQGASWWVKWP